MDISEEGRKVGFLHLSRFPVSIEFTEFTELWKKIRYAIELRNNDELSEAFSKRQKRRTSSVC